MQTFLPYPSFTDSAACLDNKRLGKQRVEAKQILETNLKVLADPTAKVGWMNHPAVLMWRGYEDCLAFYGFCMCNEWIVRGFKDSLREYFFGFIKKYETHPPCPRFIDREDFHLSHKSNLIRKAPEHYAPLWPDVPNDLPYIWPVSK